MKLKHILLENVCQFPHLEHEFHPGLTGVIGPNGSGKSNLTKAIYFALTGAFRNVGVKADNVAQLGQGRRSSVTLDFEHDGVPLTVVRGLARTPTSLTIADDPEPVTGDVAVTARIMEIIGVDAKLLGDYVFILQLHMTDFIEAAPADRAAVFQRLFGADRFEEVHKFITQVIDRELVEIEVADAAPIRARLGVSTGRMNDLVDRLERLDAAVTEAAAREPAARQLIADGEWTQWAGEELARLDQRAAHLRADVETYAQVRDRSAAELATLEESLVAVAQSAQQARVALATWQAVEDRRRRADQLARRRKRLEEDAAEHPRPVSPAQPDQADEDELRSLRAREGQLERQVELARRGVPECPTCGQPVAPVNVDELLGEIGLISARITFLETKKQAYDRHAEVCARWRDWHDTYTRRQADLKVDEQTLGDEPMVPAGDPAELRQIIKQESGLRDTIAQLRTRQAQALRDYAQVQGALTELQDQRRALEVGRIRRAVAADVLQEAANDLVRLTSLREKRAGMEGEVAELARTLDADEALAGRLEESLVRAALIRRLRAGAEQVAAVTHRNAAPRLIAEGYLDHLIGDIDDFLDIFGADFRIRLGDKLGFIADFVDGRMQAAGRLSEGQKGVLALAFWVAVNSLFAGKIGFLSLDEPTASLDQHSLGALEVALGRLRDLSESTGLQCLLVTHEPSLAGLFDGVLQL
jgi:DNA repair exonuclease SbcCD ATPase subunit